MHVRGATPHHHAAQLTAATPPRAQQAPAPPTPAPAAKVDADGDHDGGKGRQVDAHA